MFKETILSGLDCGVLLTRKEYDEIISSFEKWRDERRISISSQTKTYVGNILEEITEYERAKNELEKIDALCDMAVFHINSSTNLRYENYCESAYTHEDEVPESKTSELLNTISIIIANKDIQENDWMRGIVPLNELSNLIDEQETIEFNIEHYYDIWKENKRAQRRARIAATTIVCGIRD